MGLENLMMLLSLAMNPIPPYSPPISHVTYDLSDGILKNVSANGDKRVSLSKLSIEGLADNCFDGLETVESLDLSHNDLYNLPKGIFSKMKNLKQLSLSHNRLNEFFNTTTLGLTNLDGLDLSNTRVIGLETGQLFGISESGMVGVEKGLWKITTTVFENPLIPVAPANEELPAIHYNYPWNYKDPVMCIQTSDNTLISIPIFRRESPSIECTSWSRVSQLNDGKDIHVDLSSQKISNIKDNVFNGIETTLDELNLQGNLFTSTAFARKLPNKTRTLTLDSNPISIIPLDSFYNLENLEEISLSNAQLTNIEPGTFRHQKKLKSLMLNHNEISELKPGFFEGLDSLKSINLDNNKITKIPSNMFTGWNHPASIYLISLNKNPISTIEDSAFSGMNIKYLRVGGNSLGDDGIREGSFYGSTIYELALIANKVTRFDGEWFKSISGLKEIIVSGPRVTRIEKGFAKYMKDVISLNVENTAVEYLLKGDLFGLSKDKKVSVDLPRRKLKIIQNGLFDDV